MECVFWRLQISEFDGLYFYVSAAVEKRGRRPKKLDIYNPTSVVET